MATNLKRVEHSTNAYNGQMIVFDGGLDFQQKNIGFERYSMNNAFLNAPNKQTALANLDTRVNSRVSVIINLNAKMRDYSSIGSKTFAGIGLSLEHLQKHSRKTCVICDGCFHTWKDPQLGRMAGKQNGHHSSPIYCPTLQNIYKFMGTESLHKHMKFLKTQVNQAIIILEDDNVYPLTVPDEAPTKCMLPASFPLGETDNWRFFEQIKKQAQDSNLPGRVNRANLPYFMFHKLAGLLQEMTSSRCLFCLGKGHVQEECDAREYVLHETAVLGDTFSPAVLKMLANPEKSYIYNGKAKIRLQHDMLMQDQEGDTIPRSYNLIDFEYENQRFPSRKFDDKDKVIMKQGLGKNCAIDHYVADDMYVYGRDKKKEKKKDRQNGHFITFGKQAVQENKIREQQQIERQQQQNNDTQENVSAADVQMIMSSQTNISEITRQNDLEMSHPPNDHLKYTPNDVLINRDIQQTNELVQYDPMQIKRSQRDNTGFTQQMGKQRRRETHMLMNRQGESDQYDSQQKTAESRDKDGSDMQFDAPQGIDDQQQIYHHNDPELLQYLHNDHQPPYEGADYSMQQSDLKFEGGEAESYLSIRSRLRSLAQKSKRNKYDYLDSEDLESSSDHEATFGHQAKYIQIKNIGIGNNGKNQQKTFEWERQSQDSIQSDADDMRQNKFKKLLHNVNLTRMITSTLINQLLLLSPTVRLGKTPKPIPKSLKKRRRKRNDFEQTFGATKTPGNDSTPIEHYNSTPANAVSKNPQSILVPSQDNDLQNIKQEMDQQVESFSNNFTQLNEQIKGMQTQVLDMKRSIAEDGNKQSQLVQTVDALSLKLATLLQKHQALSSAVDQAQAFNSQANSQDPNAEFQSLKQDFKALDSKFVQVEKNVANALRQIENQVDLSQVRTTVSQIEGSLQDLYQRMNEQSNAMTTKYQTLIETNRVQQSQIEQKLKDQQNQIEQQMKDQQKHLNKEAKRKSKENNKKSDLDSSFSSKSKKRRRTDGQEKQSIGSLDQAFLGCKIESSQNSGLTNKVKVTEAIQYDQAVNNNPDEQPGLQYELFDQQPQIIPQQQQPPQGQHREDEEEQQREDEEEQQRKDQENFENLFPKPQPKQSKKSSDYMSQDESFQIEDVYSHQSFTRL